MNRDHYQLFAAVLHFPADEFPAKVEALHRHLTTHYPEEGSALEPFVQYARQAGRDQREEIYTRTFDVQAMTTLDLGYVLFGDDYKRGELLSNLNREHNAFGIDCNNELADNLANVLKLIAQLRDEELVQEMVETLIVPALRKMIDEFDPERIATRNRLFKKHYKTVLATSDTYATVYLHLLQVLFHVLCSDFTIVARPLLEQSSDFLKSLGTEMELES